MNIKNDMNDITIDYYTVENFNDINSQAPSCLMDSLSNIASSLLAPRANNVLCRFLHS